MPDSALGATKKTGVTNQKNCDACFVEIDGFEPTTLCLQSRCSSQLSYTPVCRSFERLLRCPPSSVGHYHQVTPSLFSRPPCIHLKITSKVIGNLFGVCCVRLHIVGRSLPLGNSLPPHSPSLHPSKNKLQNPIVSFWRLLRCR